jgi:hypothetical protein
MKRSTVVMAVCVVAIFAGVCHWNAAHARPKYFSAFKAKYLGDDEAKMSDAQKKLAELAKEEKCSICHDPRKDESGKASKKNRNPYGVALSKFLSEKDKRDGEKAAKMLEKIEKEKPKDAKESDPTFGELIKQGKLPFEYKDAE